MNIVLYVNSFLPRIGGRELVVFHLARALDALGHEVRVVGPAAWRENRKLAFPFPVHRQPAIGSMQTWRQYAVEGRTRAGLKGVLQEQFKFAQLVMDLKRWGCDVIHAHNTYPTGYIATRVRRFMDVPVVVTPHGEDVHTVPEIGFGLRLNPLLATRIKHALARADAITAISVGVENSLRTAGADAQKIHLIPNGVDAGRFSSSSTTDDGLGLPARAKVITTIGNYHPRKGHEYLVRAMSVLAAEQPDAHLVIVGRGTEALAPMIRQMQLSDRILLAGALPVPLPGSAAEKDDRLAALLRRSAVYVSAGIGEGAEGLSLAILEAMAAGLPVVATRISGNRDIVVDGQNGLLVPPGDPPALAHALHRLLADEPCRQRCGAQARAAAMKLDWREVAGQYLALYEQLAERRRQLAPQPR